jgi:hypothetical protein
VKLSLGLSAAALALGVLLGPSAWAGLLGPGQSIIVPADEYEPPQGTLLAERSRVITVVYDPGQYTFAPGFDPSFDLELRSQVLRDATTKRLTFVYAVYQMAPDPALDSERSLLRVSSFAGFAADATGLLATGAGPSVLARSLDGASITIDELMTGQAGSPILVVRTDANSFDDQGTGFLLQSTEFTLFDGDNALITNAHANAPLSGLYPPVIPLPAAAWTGLAMLGLMGLMRRRMTGQGKGR